MNNEKLIIEEISVGKLNKTQVAICYLKHITNDDLVAEVKHRLNNLNIKTYRTDKDGTIRLRF